MATNFSWAECSRSWPAPIIHPQIYYGKLPDVHYIYVEQLSRYFLNAKFISDHQIYLLLRHVFLHQVKSEACISFARKQLKRSELDDYTRDYARAILGEFGDTSDLDAIEAEYARTTRVASKATILCSIRRMVRSRRNTIYSRAGGDSFLVDQAVQFGKRTS